MADWFYFVCCCGAKWFLQTKRSRCPRCNARASSNSKYTPPRNCDSAPKTSLLPIRNAQQQKPLFDS
jgi:hypothetical protein